MKRLLFRTSSRCSSRPIGRRSSVFYCDPASEHRSLTTFHEEIPRVSDSLQALCSTKLPQRRTFRQGAMSAIHSVFAAAIASGTLACAPAAYDVHIMSAGVVDVQHDRHLVEKAMELHWEADDVTVFHETPPDGLSIANGELVIEPAYAARYRLVGTLSSSQKDGIVVSLQSIFLYPPFHSTVSRGRDAYCKGQTPLRILTLGMWSIFSPFNWACFPTQNRDFYDSMAIHVGELRRAAAVLGANIVVIGKVRERQTISGSVGRFGASATTTTVAAAAVDAFAIVDSGASGASAATRNPPQTFDREKAAAALAQSLEKVAECRTPDGPTGPGHARITFAASGDVTNVEMDPPFAGNSVGECLAKKLRTAKVPPFDGDPVTLGKTFVLPNANET